MREIGSSVRFLRDKFVPLYSERGYSDKDIRNKEVLALFSCGFVPFLSRQNFVSWCKILQVADLKRLVRMIKGRISLTTSNHQKGFFFLIFSFHLEPQFRQNTASSGFPIPHLLQFFISIQFDYRICKYFHIFPQ